MKINTENHTQFIILMKCILGAYLVTAGLLLLLAFFLYRFGFTEKLVSAVIICIYIIATFLAGLIAGKKMKNRKFLWGLLTGAMYFVILLVVSFIIDHGSGGISGNLLTTFLICAGSGMLGGMIG